MGFGVVYTLSHCRMAEMSEEGMAKLRECFGELGAKPKIETDEELHDWMLDYLASKGKLPAKPESVEHKDGGGDDAPEPTTEGKERVGLIQAPRIAIFSGDETGKGDTTYDLWQFEVECLREAGIHSSGTITQAVRKSLKGEAARIVKRLGTGASLATIMKKLEDVYGVVDTGETLLAEFYGARQGKDEDVTTWGCRLEDLLDRAMEHRSVSVKDMNEMLRSRFWNGLSQRLKDGSRHKFDTIADFDKLRKEIRAIEKEHQMTDQLESSQVKKGQAKMANVVGDGGVDVVRKLEVLVGKLSGQVEAMQKQMLAEKSGEGEQVMVQQGVKQAGAGQGWPKPGGHWQAGEGEQKSSQLKDGPGQQGWAPNSQPQRGFQQGWAPAVEEHRGFQQSPTGSLQPQHSQLQGGNRGGQQSLKCFKCGELGHFKPNCPRRFEPTCWGCGRLGHRESDCPDLNLRDPLSRGGR